MADDDEVIIDYIELARLAEELRKDVDRIKGDYLKGVRNAALLVNLDDSSVWSGSAATAFHAGFFDTFRPLYRLVTDELSTYQERLKRASDAYAMADRQAQSIADNIEQAQWADV